MFVLRRLYAAVFACVVALGPGEATTLHAQDDSPTTHLTFSGGLAAEATGSDTNACLLDTDGSFRAQLASVGESSIVSIELVSAAPGTFAVGPSGGPRVSVVSLSNDPNELFVNWDASFGSLTINSLESRVAVGDGSFDTRAASGTIEVDLAADKHRPLHVSGTWACHLPF